MQQFLVFLLIVILAGCEGPLDPQDENGDSAALGVQDNTELDGESMPIRLKLSKVAVNKVVRAEIVVTGPGIEEAIVGILTVEDETVVGSIVVPVGLDRVFTINAYDTSGALIYSGSGLADVISNGGTQLPPISVFAIEEDGELPDPVLVKQVPWGGEFRFLSVPSGYFTMGSELPSADPSWTEDYHSPEHPVYLDNYYISEYEVTNAQFLSFLQEYGDPLRSYEGIELDPSQYLGYGDGLQVIKDVNEMGSEFILDSNYGVQGPNSEFLGIDQENHPVVGVTWFGADRFCRAIGARLPTEAEWEKAARGTDSRYFPWGNQFVAGWANTGLYPGSQKLSTEAVGSYSNDRSPFGAYDMGGNASEWCADWYEPHYYFWSPIENPVGPDKPGQGGVRRVVRGGSWTGSIVASTTYFRGHFFPASRNYQIGFRCACDPE